MNEWAAGYRAALRDVDQMVRTRFLVTGDGWDDLIRDLQQDARVIDHELTSREQKRRLAAGREAHREPVLFTDALPLFKDKP